MKNKILCLLVLILSVREGTTQSVRMDAPSANDSASHFFIAYDFGEAIFNNFQSLSGEVGVSLPNKHLIRLVHMNVKFTEGHLSSDFAVPVKGDNVEGSMLGFEAFYSLPIRKWRDDHEAIYISPSIGYYTNEYWHTQLDERLKQGSGTLGLELSYRETNPFRIKGLYYAITIPVRVHFNPYEKTTLGETEILGNRLDNNIWFFVGYQF